MKTETKEGRPIYCEISAYEPNAGRDIKRGTKMAMIGKYGGNYPNGTLLHVRDIHTDELIPTVVIDSRSATLEKLNPTLLALFGALNPQEAVDIMSAYPYTDDDTDDWDEEGVYPVKVDSSISFITLMSAFHYSELSPEIHEMLKSTPLEEMLTHPLLKHLFLPTIWETCMQKGGTMEEFIIFLLRNDVITSAHEIAQIKQKYE